MYPREGEPDTSRSEMGVSSDDTDELGGRGSDQGGKVHRDDEPERRTGQDNDAGSDESNADKDDGPASVSQPRHP